MELHTPAADTPTQRDVLDIQQALWDNGLMRGAGNSDVLIAAYAMVNDLTILTAPHRRRRLRTYPTSGRRHPIAVPGTITTGTGAWRTIFDALEPRKTCASRCVDDDPSTSTSPSAQSTAAMAALQSAPSAMCR